MAEAAPPTPGWYRITSWGIEYLDDDIAANAVFIDTDGEQVFACPAAPT